MTESSITIRRAKIVDAAAIAEVHVSSWRTTYRGIVDQSYIDRLSVDERAAAWTRRLSASDSSAPDILVGTTSDDRVVGFLSGGLLREPFAEFDAELHALYLLEPFQRMGLGRRLAREWTAIALRRGSHSAIVRVLAQNAACAFYERLGGLPLRETELMIGGKTYPERWYGWRNIQDLAAE